MKFRKKPVVIEARRFNENDAEGATNLAIWCGGALCQWLRGGYGRGLVINICTLEGVMAAYHGDWIIKGVKGEFYPCKPDIFEQTYEPVEEAE